jgi:hypothetical protein
MPSGLMLLPVSIVLPCVCAAVGYVVFCHRFEPPVSGGRGRSGPHVPLNRVRMAFIFVNGVALAVGRLILAFWKVTQPRFNYYRLHTPPDVAIRVRVAAEKEEEEAGEEEPRTTASSA